MGDPTRYSEAPHTDGNDLGAVVVALDALRDEIGQRHTENTSTLEMLEKKVDLAIQGVDDLHKAFPGGDWEGHRRYHETLIAKAEARARLYEKLLEELTKKGLLALFALVAVAVWQYIKSKVTL